MEEQIPDILYHYCSVDTFVKIIQNKTLRLSEIVKSNDSMECQWLEKEIVPPILKRETESYVTLLGNSSSREATNDLRRRLQDLYYWPYHINFERLEEKSVFALCLSEVPDLLSQWRGYATDGSGVSIGLDSELFRKYSHSSFARHINFRKIIYDRAAQNNEIEADIKQFIKTIDAHRKRIYEEKLEAPESSLAPFVEFGLSMLYKSIFIKNESFSEEKEWRLFANIFNAKNISDIRKQIDSIQPPAKFSELGAMVKSERLIFYLDLMLDSEQADGTKLNLIKTLYLGPKSKLSERDVRMLLDSNGWEVSTLEVKKSKATYI